MSAYISKSVDLSSDDVVVVPINGRWGSDNNSVIVAYAGTGTVTVKGTASKLNRGETATWFDITGLTSLTTDASVVVSDTSIEALQVTGATMAGGGATVQILNGGCA